MPLLAEHVPEVDGSSQGHVIGHSQFAGAFGEFRIADSGKRHAGQVAFDVGHEDRHSQLAQALGQHAQRHGLAGSGGAGNHPVAIGHRSQQPDLVVPFARKHRERHRRTSFLLRFE